MCHFPVVSLYMMFFVDDDQIKPSNPEAKNK